MRLSLCCGLPLLGFNLFLHVEILTLCVVELILQEGEFLGRNDVHTESVFHLPLAFEAHDALVDVGSDIGMNVEIELLDAYLVDQAVDFPFELVGEENARTR